MVLCLLYLGKIFPCEQQGLGRRTASLCMGGGRERREESFRILPNSWHPGSANNTDSQISSSGSIC